ncbi:MAG: sugar phosphate nucleotidyltransferase [Nitrospirota bacterium]
MKVSPSTSPDLLVLCGGQGTRLRSVLIDRPKPLAMIGSRPFMDFVLDPFVRQGITRAVLCTGYLGHQFEAWYAEHPCEIELVFARETTPLGTAGAIRHASMWIRGDFFIAANGDSLCEIDLPSLLAAHAERQACATLALIHADHRSDVGFVAMDARQRITRFSGKIPAQRAGYYNAGIYVFNRSAIASIPASQPYSLEADWLPTLLPLGVYGFVSQAPLYDIGTPERLSEFQSIVGSADSLREGCASNRSASCG